MIGALPVALRAVSPTGIARADQLAQLVNTSLRPSCPQLNHCAYDLWIGAPVSVSAKAWRSQRAAKSARGRAVDMAEADYREHLSAEGGIGPSSPVAGFNRITFGAPFDPTYKLVCN